MRALLRLLTFLRPYRGQVVITALCAAGVMAATITLPYLTRVVIDEVLVAGRSGVLVPVLLGFLAVGALRLVLAVTRRLLAGRVSLGVEVDLRARMFGHLQRLSVGYFDRMPVGQLMSRATSDLQTVRFFLGYGLVFLFMNVFTVIAVTVLMLLIDARLALVALAVGPGLMLIAWRYTKVSNPVFVDVQQRVGEVTAMAEESISGIRIVKAFGQETPRAEGFGQTATRAFDRSMDAAWIRASYQPLIGFLPVLGLAGVLIYGGILTIDGSLSLGEFVQFYLYLTFLVGPFRVFGTLLGSAQRAIAGGKRIFEVLDANPDVEEPARPTPLPAGRGGVRLEHVTFGYGEGPAVLSDIDLDVEAGTAVALIGSTGSGKTTLTNLLPRFADPREGRVTLDGVDVRELSLTELRRAVAVVPQDPFLFSMSVGENISYGAPDATEDDVRAVARAAQADRFIDDLPKGLDTVVGERGFTLSGGQRQRIAIARAILADPRVLVLDDATASVDATTEAEIHDALRAAMRGRTTIVIAHRLSTLQLADELVVLEEGRVVARGTHEELYATSPEYREIHDHGLATPAQDAEVLR